MSLVGSLVAAYVALTLAPQMGASLLGATLAALGFYTAAHYALSRQIAVSFWRSTLPALEAMFPAALLWFQAHTEGPAYALGSWVPPQLFALAIAASMLRLRPAVPALAGLVAAASYGAVYWASIYGHTPTDLLLYQPSMQLVRMGSLALTGAAGSLAVLGLQRSITRANRDVRAHELFGKYRLGDDIASGGMGRVVEALYCPEGGFERRVAIKLIHPHLANDPHFVERFRAEAELGSRLHHPGIVASLDFGRSDDQWFFVMEYVDGKPLSDLLRERRELHIPLPPQLVASIGLQLAEALDYAHHRALDVDGVPLRVVHRDLSPSNVLIDHAGQVKISDFGVARALREARGFHTQSLVGKPSYMAPETLRREEIGPASDLWSLGVLLWEAVANERLFQRDTEAATLLAVVESPVPPVSSIRLGLHPHWEPFFARALARDPQRRFQSAGEMRSALATVVAREGAVPSDAIGALLDFGEEELLPDDTSEVISAEEHARIMAENPPAETV